MSHSQYRNQKLHFEGYRCLRCENIDVVDRPYQKLKEYGHKKHMYCDKCMKVTIHVNIGTNINKLLKYIGKR